jgi:hypothetical protein
MLDGIIFMVGFIVIIASRFLYFKAYDVNDIIGAIILDAVGTLVAIISLLDNFGMLLIK